MKKKIKIVSVFMIFVTVFVFAFGAKAAETKFTAKGIDISYWQGANVNFEKIKQAGYSFVILRIGTSNGKDSTFENNYKKAIAAGLDVGCYFYTYALEASAAEKEAENVISWIGTKQLQYPVYFDIEDSSIQDASLTKAQRTGLVTAFNEKIKKAGFLPGVYANNYWLKYLLDKQTITDNYDLWLASWTESGQPDVDKSAECKLWQYSEKGVIDGAQIATDTVDLDVSYFDYPSYVKANGLNNYEKQEEPTTQEEPTEPTKPNTDFSFLTNWYNRLLRIIRLLISIFDFS